MTLSEYFVPTGKNFESFKVWIGKQSIFEAEPMCFQIQKCISEIEDTKWLETVKRVELFAKFTKLLYSYVESLCGGKTCITYLIDYIKELDTFCYQGGFGHYVSYHVPSCIPDPHPYPSQRKLYPHRMKSLTMPHHWVVRPEHYDKFKDIPQLIRLCTFLTDSTLEIKSIPKYERWGN